MTSSESKSDRLPLQEAKKGFNAVRRQRLYHIYI
jgi:hypothetical protein